MCKIPKKKNLKIVLVAHYPDCPVIKLPLVRVDVTIR